LSSAACYMMIVTDMTASSTHLDHNMPGDSTTHRGGK